MRNIIFATLLLFLAACQSELETVKIIYSVDEPKGEIASVLKQIIEEHTRYKVELVIGDGSLAAYDSLATGAAHLTIVENNTPLSGGVFAIAPIFPEILHILYKSDTAIHSFEDLFYGKTAYIGQEGSGSYEFMVTLFQFFEIDRSKVKLTDDIFSSDVFCGFTDLLKEEELIGLEGFKLYSFDDQSQMGLGSVTEGICMKHPQMKTFTIPRYTYGKMTPTPVFTLAVDAVLVASGFLPDDVVYDITKAVFENHQDLNKISPLIYSRMSEDFNSDDLNFPLHAASRVYLERDEPSFYERYAESIALAFTLLVATYSGLRSFAKWNSQRKKDRVDVFYRYTLDIKNKVPSLKTTEECILSLSEVRKHLNQAFQLLIDEKLLANESFRIYMELSRDTQSELKTRLRYLRELGKAPPKVI
ncbi:MAG: TAXI family TRAP transporter solute-binding subunit [Imperialibacter sp.]|uniref:TAXI family TRAP transporter solute-binding subunit n=1 Tax=Imperialibacter sp. TaxID=2038411 RepID=UPI003A880DFA